MRSLWLANAINIALDPCLIFGLGPFPELGLTGAAVATNVGRGVGVAYQLSVLFGRARRLQPRRADLRPDPALLRRLLSVAWGGIGQNLIATAARCLEIISFGYPFYARGMVTAQGFNGAGDTRTPTWICFVSFWLFQIPLAWALARALGYGPDGVFWAIALSYLLSALIGVALFRRGRWKTTTV